MNNRKSIKLIVGVLIGTCFFSHAQKNPIESMISKMPGSECSSLRKITAYLKKNTGTEKEKAFAAYVWVCKNISYDLENLSDGKTNVVKPETVIKQKKALCDGYANLYCKLCSDLGLKCFAVSGYAKGFEYNPDKKFTESDHDWNCVKFDSTWHLVDATWGAGYIKMRNGNEKFKRKCSAQYFDQPPSGFIKLHLPEIPMWQLLADPVPLSVFESDEKNISSFLASEKNKNYFFNDTISTWMKKNPEEQLYQNALMTHRFNPLNALPLALLMVKPLPQIVENYFLTRALPSKKNIDSLIVVTHGSLGLLKNCSSKNKIYQHAIDSVRTAIQTAATDLCGMRSEYPRRALAKTRLTIDSVMLLTKEYVNAMRLTIREAENGKQNKLFNDYSLRLCESCLTFYDRYAGFVSEKKFKKHEKELRSDMNFLLETIKKSALPGSKYEEQVAVRENRTE